MESPLVLAQWNASLFIDEQVGKREEHKHFTSGSQVNGNCYEKMNYAKQQEGNKKYIAWNTNMYHWVLSIQLSIVLNVAYTVLDCVKKKKEALFKL